MPADIGADIDEQARRAGRQITREPVGQVRFKPAVFADVALVERVFQNLLDNALKFTEKNGCIRIMLVNKTSGIEVSVADNGKGIALKDQPYIFGRYKQSGHEESTGKGMGLGLAIVKKILDLHHTRINIKSIPGTGTTFCFELPVNPA